MFISVYNSTLTEEWRFVFTHFSLLFGECKSESSAEANLSLPSGGAQCGPRVLVLLVPYSLINSPSHYNYPSQLFGVGIMTMYVMMFRSSTRVRSKGQLGGYTRRSCNSKRLGLNSLNELGLQLGQTCCNYANLLHVVSIICRDG